MGTPNKLLYLVPEKWQNNKFHRIISPGESENLKRRIEKAPEDSNMKKIGKIKVEENCISIDLLEPDVKIEEHSIKQEAEDHRDKNILFLGENLTPNNFEEGKNEKNVGNQDTSQLKEDCKLEQFDKEGLILSKGQLISKGLLDVIVSTKKPTKLF